MRNGLVASGAVFGLLGVVALVGIPAILGAVALAAVAVGVVGLGVATGGAVVQGDGGWARVRQAWRNAEVGQVWRGNVWPSVKSAAVRGLERAKAAAAGEFLALRDSGYIGPIDQNGDKATDPRVLDVLDRLAQIPDLREPEDRAAITTNTKEEAMGNTMGTGGRAAVAGVVADWESSAEARSHPETFVMWLQSQADAAAQAATLVPDLVAQYHGRGPSGHAGVPDSQIDAFTKQFEDSRMAESQAFAQWASDYAAYVEDAERELTEGYGKEVLDSAHTKHSG